MAYAGSLKKPLRRNDAAKANRNSNTSNKVKPSKINIKPKFILDPRSDWYNAEQSDLNSSSAVSNAVPPALIEKIRKHAQTLLGSDNALYAESHLKTSSSFKFMSTIMSAGTWSDKVSALTLVVQESPLHTTKPLQDLISLAGKRSRDQALMALGALKDMFGQGNVLPDRKLRMFSKQPGLLVALQDVKTSWTPEEGLPNGLDSKNLVLWAYEDLLKASYFDMLKMLEKWANDEVEFARARAVTFIFELLRDKPEQEENLLRLLVNKLGDTSKKIASRASHLLLQLQTSHPSMKSIIASSIESDILLRSGQSLHAKYYAIITLNQTILKTSDPDLANKLLDIYFSLFIAILNRSGQPGHVNTQDSQVNGHKALKSASDLSSKKRKRSNAPPPEPNKPEVELNDRITAQVLTGINRAFPFSKKDSMSFEKHLDTMFRITHSSNFNTSIQALMLVQQISSVHQMSSDRFMRTLYESLLDPRLINSSKQTMYLNLLYRSLKADTSIRRVKAFIKRLVQVLSLHEPSFIVAALYLIIELLTIHPGLQSLLIQPETNELLSDDENEEADGVATDAPRSKSDANTASDDVKQSKTIKTYDGRARNPEYSNADLTCLWDIIPWLFHYHPSVTLFANSLLSHPSTTSATNVQSAPSQKLPKPDPATHTLSHFLDRFAYRNPKTKESAVLRGQSIMQPALASAGATDSLLQSSKRATASTTDPSNPNSNSNPNTKLPQSTTNTTLNTEEFWTRHLSEIREDEVFFHKYFGVINAGKEKASKKNKKDRKSRDSETDDAVDTRGADEEGDEDWDEDEIWQAIVGSRKGKKGAEDAEDAEDEDEFEDDDVSLDMDVMDDSSDDVDEEGEEDEDGEVEIDLRSQSSSSDDDNDDSEKEDEAEEDDTALASSFLNTEADIQDGEEGGLFSDSDSDDSTSDPKSRNDKPGRKQMTEREISDFIEDARAEADQKEERRKQSKGAKTAESTDKMKKKRKLKHLPVFGDADMWASLIDGGNGDGGAEPDLDDGDVDASMRMEVDGEEGNAGKKVDVRPKKAKGRKRKG